MATGSLASSLQGAMSSGLIGAGSSSGQGLMGALFGGISARRQWKYQKKAMALQQQYALEQMQKQYEYEQQQWQYTFDQQNEYNDPTNVFARYRTAGVNPSAVLGSSGANIGATLGGETGSSTPNSGPGSSFYTPAQTAYSQALTSAQLDNIESQTNLNNANANKARGDTHDETYRRRRDELDLAAGSLENENTRIAKRINEAKAEILENDAYLASLTVGYRFEEVQAQLQILKDDAYILREQRPALAKQAQASYLATIAAAYYYAQQGDLASEQTQLTSVQIADAQRQFNLDWERKRQIQVYDEKGNVIRTENLSYKEMFMFMQENQAEASSFLVPQSRYEVRSEKNALGYGIAKALAAGLVGSAVSVAASGLAGKMKPIAPRNRIEIHKNLDKNGKIIGGTRVERRDF